MLILTLMHPPDHLVPIHRKSTTYMRYLTLFQRPPLELTQVALKYIEPRLIRTQPSLTTTLATSGTFSTTCLTLCLKASLAVSLGPGTLRPTSEPLRIADRSGIRILWKISPRRIHSLKGCTGKSMLLRTMLSTYPLRRCGLGRLNFQVRQTSQLLGPLGITYPAIQSGSEPRDPMILLPRTTLKKCYSPDKADF